MLEELQFVCMLDGLNVCCLTFFFLHFLSRIAALLYACMRNHLSAFFYLI